MPSSYTPAGGGGGAPTGAAGGDLSGTYPNPTVEKKFLPEWEYEDGGGEPSGDGKFTFNGSNVLKISQHSIGGYDADVLLQGKNAWVMLFTSADGDVLAIQTAGQHTTAGDPIICTFTSVTLYGGASFSSGVYSFSESSAGALNSLQTQIDHLGDSYATAAQGAKADTALQPAGDGSGLSGVTKPADITDLATLRSEFDAYVAGHP